MNDEPTISLYGSVHRSEFEPVLRHLFAGPYPVEVNHSLATSPEDRPQELLVFLQSYPGEFPDRAVRGIRARNPLAPALLLAGAYTAGEERTGCPPQGLFRLYVHQWSEFYRDQIFAFLAESPSIFSLPSTVGKDEWILEEDKIGKGNCPEKNLSAVIVSGFGPLGNDSALNGFLADWVRCQGWNLVPFSVFLPNSFSGIVLADSDDQPFSEIFKAVQRLRQLYADANIRVYINSPGIDEKKDLEKLGVERVLSKH